MGIEILDKDVAKNKLGEVEIFDKNDNKVLDVLVDDDSYRYRGVQINKVFLRYSLPEHIELQVGSYLEYAGEKYTLWLPSNFRKEGSRNFQYSVELGGNQEYLRKLLFMLITAKPHQLKFPFTATPRVFLQLMVDILNTFDNDWKIGRCIESTEKTLSFNHENCYSVLCRLAKEFNTEWEIVGKTINFCKVEYFKDAPLNLSYGRGNGFKTGVGRQNDGEKRPVTMLFAIGGDKNLDSSKYGSPSLLLPKSQELEYEGRRYKTDEDGLFIMRADKELIEIEQNSYDGSHIYPKRIGTVSRVDVGKEGEYDIIDSSIPAELDFSKYRIGNEKATLKFESGNLAGREFDIVQTEDALTGYVHAERRFKLVPYSEGGITFPNATLCPKVGDKYAIFHIALPDAYICNNSDKSGASWDLFRESVRCFYEAENASFTFTGELNGIWAKENWLDVGGKIRPGGYVHFSDKHFQPGGVLIRITGVKDYFCKPHSPVIELSNSTAGGYLENELGKIESNEVVTEELFKDSVRYTERRWQDAKALQTMLEKAFLDFSKGINPIWVQTMAILVGDESLQFRFVNSRTKPVEVNHTFTYNNTTKVFSTGAGIIQHMTLGIDKLSNAHKDSEYKFWNMSAFTSPALDSTPEAMYLYSKCSKTGSTGTFKLSPTAIRLDPGDGYYYFLTGTLSADVEGVRSFVPLYGFTEIGPGWIRLREIISQDGLTYFDLVNGIIGGRIYFDSGTSGYENIRDKPDLGIYGTKDMLNAIKGDLQNQIDSKIETYYGASNPWNSWPSGTEPAHVGDLWYNTSTKILQRYVGPSSNTWSRIEDAAAIAAAAAASEAQDTADGKRRVFLSTPYPPYDQGDQWIQYGGKGEMRICVRSRQSGSYSSGDWQLSSADGNTQASIDRGIFSAAGFLTFGGTAGLVGDGRIRIWSGGANADNATFKVFNDGSISSDSTITANDAIMLRDQQAGVMGRGTADTSIRFWAGSSAPGSAPFRVQRNGKVFGTDCEFSGGKIGRFKINPNGRLTWNQADYFGNSSSSVKLGYTTGNEGVLDVTFNAGTEGKFGVKSVGRNLGGACIYASSLPSQSYPSGDTTWAGYFDGAVMASSLYTRVNGKIVQGISFGNNIDLDNHRFTVVNGMITELWKE